MKLDKFNTLAPKPEYIRKVKKSLSQSSVLKLSEIVEETGLSRTQVLCALTSMVNAGEVEKDQSRMNFRLIKFGDS